MDKSIIENMNREEILELLSPYLNAGESGKSYYEMIKSYPVRLELSKNQINIYANIVDNDWTPIGSIGSAIRSMIVEKYHEMIINKRNKTINKIINGNSKSPVQ